MTSRARKRTSNASDEIITSDELRTKKSKTSSSYNLGLTKAVRKIDANGDKYWEISKMRRVTVSSFRGKTMVSLREYYEKDGQELPGKKGISLPIDQFRTFMTLLPDIEDVLKESGVSIPRPDYTARSSHSDGGHGGNDSEAEADGAGAFRKNIEATSDEDESEG